MINLVRLNAHREKMILFPPSILFFLSANHLFLKPKNPLKICNLS